MTRMIWRDRFIFLVVWSSFHSFATRYVLQTCRKTISSYLMINYYMPSIIYRHKNCFRNLNVQYRNTRHFAIVLRARCSSISWRWSGRWFCSCCWHRGRIRLWTLPICKYKFNTNLEPNVLVSGIILFWWYLDLKNTYQLKTHPLTSGWR